MGYNFLSNWKNKKEQIERYNKFKDKKECDYSKTKYGYYETDNCFNKKALEDEKNKKYEEPKAWTIKSKITEKIKVKNYFYENEDNRRFFEYSKNYKEDFFPIKIKWYSKIYRIANYDKWNKQENYAEFNAEKWEIIIKEHNKEITKFSIKEINDELIKKFSKNDNRDLKKADLTFEIEWGKYRLLFENIIILNPDFKEKEKNENKNIVWLSHLWWYVSWYLFVK